MLHEAEGKYHFQGNGNFGKGMGLRGMMENWPSFFDKEPLYTMCKTSFLVKREWRF